MSGPPQSNPLPVSLEPHLVEKLRPLVHALPAPLSAELSPLLSLSETSSSSTPTISYALLSSLSRWVRTEDGARALKSKDPPLNPLAYSMVALLAGTRTSPDKKFPQSSPHSSLNRSEGAAREISDRRAVIAVLNAFLSILCTGAATWWATQRTGWRDEWRMLLALLAATIVAISEAGLYIIWESRRRRPPAKTEANRRLPPHDYSVGDANTRDVSGDTPSGPAHLDGAQSQASTSIDPHQPSARMALRQRVGTTSKSRSR